MRQLAALLYCSPMFVALAGYHYLGLYGIAAGLGPVALIALGAKTRLFPIVRWGKLDGANGRNWPLFVYMDKRANYPLAVLAQEIYESNYKLNPIKLLKTRWGEGARDLELRGHEVEVQAAVRLYDVPEIAYRRLEASAMAAYYPQFDDMTSEDIEVAMLTHTPMARRWVAGNLDYLER